MTKGTSQIEKLKIAVERIDARQWLMGHESIAITLFTYGSDRHAAKTRMDKLRQTLSEIQ